MTTTELEKQRNVSEKWVTLVSGQYQVKYEESQGTLEIRLPDGDVYRYGTTTLYAMEFAQKLRQIQHINEELAAIHINSLKK